MCFKRLILMACVGLLCVAAATAFAQGPPPGGTPPGPPDPAVVDQIIKIIDANKDGVLQPEEVKAWVKQAYAPGQRGPVGLMLLQPGAAMPPGGQPLGGMPPGGQLSTGGLQGGQPPGGILPGGQPSTSGLQLPPGGMPNPLKVEALKAFKMMDSNHDGVLKWSLSGLGSPYDDPVTINLYGVEETHVNVMWPHLPDISFEKGSSKGSSPDKYEKMKKAYDFIDKNKDGVLQQDEVMELVTGAWTGSIAQLWLKLPKWGTF